MKPSVEHLRTFGCKVWVQIPDKTRKSMVVKAKFAILLRCLSYGKYCVILDETLTVQVSRDCKIVEDKISRGDKCCVETGGMVEQSMEFERVSEYHVSANGSPGEGGLENLLKNAARESGRPEDGSDGTNSADDNISSVERTEAVRRRSGRVSKPPERFQDIAMLFF